MTFHKSENEGNKAVHPWNDCSAHKGGNGIGKQASLKHAVKCKEVIGIAKGRGREAVQQQTQKFWGVPINVAAEGLGHGATQCAAGPPQRQRLAPRREGNLWRLGCL